MKISRPAFLCFALSAGTITTGAFAADGNDLEQYPCLSRAAGLLQTYKMKGDIENGSFQDKLAAKTILDEATKFISGEIRVTVKPTAASNKRYLDFAETKGMDLAARFKGGVSAETIKQTLFDEFTFKIEDDINPSPKAKLPFTSPEAKLRFQLVVLTHNAYNTHAVDKSSLVPVRDIYSSFTQTLDELETAMEIRFDKWVKASDESGSSNEGKSNHSNTSMEDDSPPLVPTIPTGISQQNEMLSVAPEPTAMFEQEAAITSTSQRELIAALGNELWKEREAADESTAIEVAPLTAGLLYDDVSLSELQSLNSVSRLRSASAPDQEGSTRNSRILLSAPQTILGVPPEEAEYKVRISSEFQRIVSSLPPVVGLSSGNEHSPEYLESLSIPAGPIARPYTSPLPSEALPSAVEPKNLTIIDLGDMYEVPQPLSRVNIYKPRALHGIRSLQTTPGSTRSSSAGSLGSFVQISPLLNHPRERTNSQSSFPWRPASGFSIASDTHQDQFSDYGPHTPLSVISIED